MKHPQGSWAGTLRVARSTWKGTVLAVLASLGALALSSERAAAGPNAGGTLILHTDTGIVYTDDDFYIGLSGIDCGYATDCPPSNSGSCQSGITNANVDAHDGLDPQVWWVFAAFPTESCPVLSSVSFGVYYPESDLELWATGWDADTYEPYANYPWEDATGVKFHFDQPRRSQLVEICYFAGVVLNGQPYFSLGGHPLDGGSFYDDSASPIVDPIAGFSSLGFGTAGYQALPGGGGTPTGACCFGDLSCSQLTYDDCWTAGGTYYGDYTDCATSCNGGGGSEGACCQPNGTCVVVSYSNCLAGDQYYHGDGTTCETWSCPVGACCLPNETCVIVTYDACWAYAGTYYGDGSSCAGLNCSAPSEGACCAYDGFCYIATSFDCWDSFDTYEGDGTTCIPNPCTLPPLGACCSPSGTCQLETGFDCDSMGWGYKGDGTSCNPNPCPPPPAACCLPNGSCSFVTVAECATLGGTFQGAGTTCSPDPCPDPEGACCSTAGTCTILSSSACSSSGGSYQGNGTTCAPNPCPEPTGACCLTNGTCSVLTSDACVGVGGSYLGASTTCSPNPCPDPTGACCRTDGSCFVTTSALCTAEGSSYQGNGAVCVPDPCPDPTGACCLSTGSCSVMTLAACVDLSGAYQGNNVVCNPNPCPDPSGACCLVSGTCAFVTSDECTAAGGTYQGDNVACSPDPCPDPTGGCCFEDGSCLIRTMAECEAAPGVYHGHGTVCSPNPCPQPPPEGACCFADGSCTITTTDGCAGASGSYRGDDTVCSPNPCPQPPAEGACCFADGSCTVGTAADCDGSAGSYEGDDTTCDPNPCPQPAAEGACCYEDGNCAVRTEAACGTESGTYQGDESDCDPNPCPQPPAEGACCFEDGSCSVGTEDACDTSSGTYQGDDSTCDPNPCPQPPDEGACCFEDGSCSVGTEDACDTNSGTYEGDDSTCAPNPCPQPPATGACCFENGTCDTRAKTDCTSVGGSYEGDDTSCDPNPCPQPAAEGACCFDDGSCRSETSADCSTAEGSYQGDETSCDPNPCPQPAATGACCASTGACSVETQADCENGGDTYSGDSTVCDPNPCAQPRSGACCDEEGACTVVLGTECDASGGDFLGADTTCDPHPCDLEPHVSLGVDGIEGARSRAFTLPSFVNSLECNYRMGGEVSYRRVTGWSKVDDVWRADFDDAHYTERGLEYYLTLNGGIGVGSPTSPIRHQTVGHDVAGPRLASGVWSMLGAPVLVDGRLTYYDELVAMFGSQDGDRWKIGTYDPVQRAYVQVSPTRPAAFESGKAYWVGSVDPPSSWSVQGDSRLPLAGALDYLVTLRPGWNMVGNPAAYSVTIDRSNLRVVVQGDTLSFADASFGDDPAVASAILTFNADGGGSYKNELETLSVWSGCWVKNLGTSSIGLLIPATENGQSLARSTSGGGPLATSWGDLAQLDTSPEWVAQITARSDVETRSALLGVVERRSPTGNDIGFLPPAPPGAKLQIELIGQGGHVGDGESLFQELRTSRADEEVWRAVVESDADEATLSLGFLGGRPEEWEVKLRTPGGSERPAETVQLTLGPGRHEFEIVARRLTPGVPSSVELGLMIQPNPSTGSTRLEYQVPFDARVLLQVFDPSGARVWSRESHVGPGAYVAEWDGRASDGRRMASGIYFVRIDAVSGVSGEAVHRIEKLVLVR
ncbi:MAG: hypothetical protein R3E97_13550 [Candidatus Eisenbacteria bacterium]